MREEFSLVEQVKQQYVENLRLSWSFLILLVFIFFFLRFSNMALGGGTIFFDYSLSALSWQVILAEVLGGLLFLAMYSILLSLLLLAVRNDLSHIKVRYYLKEMVQKFFLTMFVYFMLMGAVFILLILAGLWLNIPLVWVNALLLILSLLLVFVPQSLVIDEKPIFEAIETNLYVIRAHPKEFLLVVVVSMVLVGLLPLVEAFVDYVVPFGGRYVAILLMFAFVIPVLEILKTILYMNRFELVRGHEYAKKRHHGLRHA